MALRKNLFSRLIKQLADLYFESSQHRLPIYNAGMVASGLKKYIGRIVVHFVVHGGTGFPLFSPIAYQ